MKQYVDRLSGEPARRQACRSGVSAVAVEVFVNNAGKLALVALSVVVGWWAVSSFDYERHLSLASLTQRLNNAGPWAPLLLIGSMVCAVLIPEE